MKLMWTRRPRYIPYV